MLDSGKLNDLLANNLERLLQELLPDGRHVGPEYHCASCYGGRGDSFKLNTRKLLWKDFASDEKAGDLISLFIVRAGGNKAEGMKSVYDFLGIKQKEERRVIIKPDRKFTKPKPDWEELDAKVYHYLIARGLTDEVLTKYEVMMHRAVRFGSNTDECYVFIYKSQNGKQTYLAKYVSIERDGGKKKIVAQAGGLPVLYGMHAILPNSDYIVITSGELDALSYAVAGQPAVSIPNGDKNLQWIENSWDFLAQFKTIYLSFDMDHSGQEMVHIVAARLGVERCRKVVLPYKDANECLGHKVDLSDAIRDAEDITPIGFIHSNALEEDVWSELQRGPRPLQGIPFMGWEYDESINFRIRPHEVTVYLGMEFSGKSTILYQLASWLAGVCGHRIALASLEESPEAILGIMLSQWLARPATSLTREQFDQEYRRTIGESIFIFNDRTAEAPLKDILSFAEYCVKRYGAQHVIIDSITCTDLDVESNEDANAFMKAIIKSCNETQAHYHLVCHAKKGTHDEYERASIPKKRDIKGSVTIPALATNIISMWRHSLKQAILDNKRQSKYSVADVENWEDAIIAVRKNKVGGLVGEFPLFFDNTISRFRRAQHKSDVPYIPQG